MNYQCCICKQAITDEDKQANRHNPCSLTLRTSFDEDVMQQKEQVFFCHIECFKKFYDDDATFYLEAMETPLEAQEDTQRKISKMDALTDYMYDMGEQTDLWEVLFEKPSGTWHSLLDMYQGMPEVEAKIIEAQNEFSIPLLVMWNSDYASHQRSKNCIWRVVLMMTEDYDYPVSLLIGSRRKP